MKPVYASLAFAACLASLSAAETFKIENNQLVLPSPLTFKTGSGSLDEEASAPALKHIQAYLAGKPYISTLRIEAHTDSAGRPDDNQKLSEERALAVARWLVGHGVDCKRLLAVGFGDTKPIALNSTPDGRAQNRRITLVNAALRGRPIGGMPVDGGGKPAGDPCK